MNPQTPRRWRVQVCKSQTGIYIYILISLVLLLCGSVAGGRACLFAERAGRVMYQQNDWADFLKLPGGRWTY